MTHDTPPKRIWKCAGCGLQMPGDCSCVTNVATSWEPDHMMVLNGQLRFETTPEHIARDMAEGRFPGRSEPQVIVIPDAEQRMILASEAEAMVAAALRAERDELKQKLISPDPYEDTAHFDDHSVNRFAAVMKGKLASKRLQGRGGWQEPEVPNGYLSRLLREHVDKGDPVDVANFAMMIHQRGERIAPENEGASCKAIDKAEAERDTLRVQLADAQKREAGLRAMIRVNMLRYGPADLTHEDIDRQIGAALSAAPTGEESQ